ncbi:MAG TPA: squalene--hopene cyclase [Armatimonadota bacterium]|jgi:squalene-hopene/tetraprenyl-beta-curcumene cyclase
MSSVTDPRAESRLEGVPNPEGPMEELGPEVQWLLERQTPEGYWEGVLESNSCMEAQGLLALHFLGLGDSPQVDGLVRAILREQREDGAWETYHDAPDGDINTTVECYAALRAAGYPPDYEPLSRAREWILARGGLGKTRVFTRYWLALLGEWPWECTPALPPEIIFLPSWFPFSIYQFASWARATLIPLCVLSARRPVRPLPPESRLDELFPEGREQMSFRAGVSARTLSTEGLFLLADRLLSHYVRLPWNPGRETAIRLCLEWFIRRQDADGGWGGIQPPSVYALMALHTEGYALYHPVMASGLKAFQELWTYEKGGAIYIQASNSPVWDTMLALMALLDCGITPANSKEMQRALDWLLAKQVTVTGDWQVRVPEGRPGGWAFERANDFYPDIDDTAVAITVLARILPHVADPAPVQLALDRAEQWLRSMQCENGGWAAFDRDNTQALVARIPFCDFGEALDPPSVDVTAHVVEALAYRGHGPEDPAVSRALHYLKAEQEPEGSWFGRWGVNHIYGTAAVLPALKVVGEDMGSPYIRRAAEWVAAHQNADGGWGESCASYQDPAQRGVGPSTASQTAWAMMALLAADPEAYRDVLLRGEAYLHDTREQGTWHEPQYTGTGFPGYGFGAQTGSNASKGFIRQGTELSRGFMINYNLYRHYFPVMALGRLHKALGSRQG